MNSADAAAAVIARMPTPFHSPPIPFPHVAVSLLAMEWNPHRRTKKWVDPSGSGSEWRVAEKSEKDQ